MIQKSSDAIEPGTTVDVGTASTLVMDAVAADRALVVIFVNNSLEDITVRPAAAGAVPNHGVVLKAEGGAWREENAATAFCACHHGASGTVELSVVMI